MEILSTDFITSIGEFLINYPIGSVFAMIVVFLLRGEVATLFAVYLAQEGYLGWAKFIMVGFFSVVLQDYIFYWLGKYGRKTKISSWLESKISGTEKLEKYLKEKTAKALILTKYTIGFNSITVLLSGWSQIDDKKFFKITIIASAMWFGIMTGLGFALIKILGFFDAKGAFDSAGLILGAIVVLVFVFEYLAQKYFTETTGVEKEKDIIEA